ncbi:FUSC family protein [Roseomonas sp. ACRSG]|nr:FUSC family protein [Roseomonas sp. ACRSG]
MMLFKAPGGPPRHASSRFRRLCAHCLNATRWDPFRLTLQTILAVLISYNAARWLRLPDPSWAVFSALYVIQGSVGGTLTAAKDRVLGAMLGSLIALACIYLIGLGGWQTILSLLVGIGSMSLLAGLKPRFSYGLVPVAILIVAPGMELIEDALLKIAAIALGATAGAAASVLILPRQAHRSAEQHLAQALAGCSELLSTSMAKILAQDAADLQVAHERIARELAAADAMIQQTRLSRRRARRMSLIALLKQTERLWYTLAMADRLSAQPLSEEAKGRLAEPVRNATRAVDRFLCELGKALAGGEAPSRAANVQGPVNEVATVIEDMRLEGLLHSLPREEAEQVLGLSLAWRQLTRNIDDILQAAGVHGRDDAAA